MAKALSILYVTSEVFPFAKETGVGDISFSLPLAIKDIGHDIRVMLPKYGCISERKNKIHEINRLRDMPVPIGDLTEPATVKSSSIANPRVKVQAYITTNKKYFDSKKGIYHDPVTWEIYPDNAERFIFFCRSVVETCLLLGWFPDIIHCNDWQTALIPAYLRTLHPAKFKKTKTVFTIHNFAGQGVFPLAEFKNTGLAPEVLANFKHKNQFNMTKGGIIYANHVTTVSPTYGKEILSEKVFSNGLNSILKEHSSKYTPVLNGIDPYVWNPSHDDLLESKYDGNLDDFKYNNKVALMNRFDFEYSPKRPLIGMISKLDSMKGVDVLIEAIPEIMKHDVQFVLLGQGDIVMKEQLEKFNEIYEGRFKAVFAIDEELAHRMEAGSDMFLLPAAYEPFGLNLIYSMLYGAVPIVHPVGGMKDIAENFNKETGEGNSIFISGLNKSELVESITKAVELFKDKETWENLIENGMQGDYTWNENAEKYVEIYRNIMKE